LRQVFQVKVTIFFNFIFPSPLEFKVRFFETEDQGNRYKCSKFGERFEFKGE
jgi:hypothetical protein